MSACVCPTGECASCLRRQRDAARRDLATARSALEAIGRTYPDSQLGDRCNACHRPVGFCDSEPIEPPYRCAGRIARAALTPAHRGADDMSDRLEYELLHDADAAYVANKINALAREGWTVHTYTTVAVPESAHAHPMTVMFTALLSRHATELPR